MNFEHANLRPYEAHVQEQRREYRDAQYDLEMIVNLARRAVQQVGNWLPKQPQIAPPAPQSM